MSYNSCDENHICHPRERDRNIMFIVMTSWYDTILSRAEFDVVTLQTMDPLYCSIIGNSDGRIPFYGRELNIPSVLIVALDRQTWIE